MPRMTRDEKVAKYMKLLKVSKAEATQMVIDDETIDNGGKCDWEVELTPEQKKIVRKARMADREIKKEKQKRTRKADDDKRELMKVLETVLNENAESVEVTNTEREISFIYNGRPFKVTLSAPRVPKE